MSLEDRKEILIGLEEYMVNIFKLHDSEKDEIEALKAYQEAIEAEIQFNEETIPRITKMISTYSEKEWDYEDTLDLKFHIEKGNWDRLDINKLSNENVLRMTKFSKCQLLEMVEVLKLSVLVEDQGFRRDVGNFNGTQVLMVLLWRLSTKGRSLELSFLSATSDSTFSKLFNAGIKYVYFITHKSISYNSSLMRQTELYSNKIDNKLNLIKFRIPGLSNDTILHIAGFIDGSHADINRPGNIIEQAIYYHGKTHTHCLSFDVVILPSGLCGQLSTPSNGSRHDMNILQSSHLLNRLEQDWMIRDDNDTNSISHYRLFGDKAYDTLNSKSPCLISQKKARQTLSIEGNKKLENLNSTMARLRICNEWGIGFISRQFPYVFTGDRSLGRERVVEQIVISCFFTNAISVYNDNQTSLYFDCSPPTALDYFTSAIDESAIKQFEYKPTE